MLLKLFNSECERNKVVLNWITDNEFNSSHFTLQRSMNGSVWEDIGTVTAAGNSGGERKYNFVDNNPLSNGFYRLAQYDLDGKVNYSPILRSACTVNEVFTLWPNPATNRIILNLQSTSTAVQTVRVYDSKGAAVITKTITLLPGLNQIEINVSRLTAGTYITVIDGTRTKTFIKK